LQGIFNPQDYPDLLVGLGDPDDAAVWRINPDQAMVATTDFFTPVVDNPYDYGAIAAANSLSDVYAMGGRPVVALNIAAMPPNLPAEIIGEILRGGAEKTRQAGAVIAGGHTIQDREPKYGLVVIGLVDPKKLMTKGGARPGDILVLSKPLGFGVTTTALKADKARPGDVDEAVEWMKRLNNWAAELAVKSGVQAATDITGYSLMGHAWEMAAASQVGMRFTWEKLPFIKGAFGYADEYAFPGGAYDNRLYFEQHVRFNRPLPENRQLLLYDPQTSGGLLLAVPSDQLAKMLDHARELNQPLWQVGEVIEGNSIEIE